LILFENENIFSIEFDKEMMKKKGHLKIVKNKEKSIVFEFLLSQNKKFNLLIHQILHLIKKDELQKMINKQL